MRVLNCLDPDQARHFVGPDLGPNCLQTTPVDKSKSRCGFRKVELLLNSLDSLEKMIGYLAKKNDRLFGEASHLIVLLQKLF